MRSVLAADLGGTKCRFALVGEDFSVHGVQHIPTSQNLEQFLDAADRAFDASRAGRPSDLQEPTAIGVGLAGLIVNDGREVFGAPNMPLDGFALAHHLEKRHGLEVALLNDGRASAWGEYLRGHARGRDPLLALFFGTGIGIGLMVEGRPYRGASSAAGEIGHTMHKPGGRTCSCGQPGHYEAYCGGRPMVERAAAEIGPLPDDRAWDVGEICRRAADDHRARQILADAETAATAMVASACTLLNPSAVVLGGGVMSGWPELREKIETFTRETCTPVVTQELAFYPSQGGSDAILWGAAAATGRLWPS